MAHLQTRTLLVAAGVHPVTDRVAPGNRCVLLDGDRIAWVGADPRDAPSSDRVIDLGGAWITPAFVDAHVHATATGLARHAVDLTRVDGAEALLAALRRHTAGPAGVLLGYGWEETRWPQPRPPTAGQLTAAAGGRAVLLTRVDAHSCLVDTTVLDRLPLERLDGVDRDADGTATGWLREQASEAAQQVVRPLLQRQDLDDARQAACQSAAQVGIGSFHEMGHPGLSGLDDALAWATGDWPVDVVTWWAELDLGVALDHGLRPGGDLFLDGSIGSCTAATSAPYGPDGGRGMLFHSDDAVAEWFSACTAAGVGGGVHVIGDRAIAQAVGALRVAADRHGVAAVRACRHRLEHVELASRAHVRALGELGVVASVQPAFDAAWGGEAGLYAQRFGAATARVSNPLTWFAEEGVVLAFGSDSTVTPLDPLGGVRAATAHLGGLGVTAQQALAAHTVGGRHVAGQDDVGRVAPGWRADLSVWSADPLSTNGEPLPSCLATIVRGGCAHGALLLQDKG